MDQDAAIYTPGLWNDELEMVFVNDSSEHGLEQSAMTTEESQKGTPIRATLLTVIQELAERKIINSSDQTTLSENEGFSRQFDVLESWVDKKVEKSWIQFHEKVQTLEFPISCNLNVPVLRFIAMQLFKRIISFQEKEGPSTPSLSTDVTAREKDILSYVGGAVVNKLSQRYANKSELLVLLLELKSEVGEAECGPSTLTATLDRGGLCFLKASFCDVLVQLENTFTDMFNNKFENIAKMAFNDRCQSELFNSFQAQFKEPGNTMLKQLFTDICSLYFTIRIHHKAKVTLEVKRGQKGLRKSLKCKEIAASKKT